MANVGVESSRVWLVVSLHTELEGAGSAGMESSIGNRRPNGRCVGFDAVDVNSKRAFGGIVRECNVDPRANRNSTRCLNVDKTLLRIGTVGLHVTTKRAAQLSVRLGIGDELPVARGPVSEQGLPSGKGLAEAEGECQGEAFVLDELKARDIDPSGSANLDKALGVGFEVGRPLSFESEIGGAVSSYNNGRAKLVRGDVVESPVKGPMSHKRGCVGKKAAWAQLGSG